MVSGLIMLGGHRHAPLAGDARRRHADRAAHRRVRGHRRAGELAVPHRWPTCIAAFKAQPESISWGGGSAGGSDQILAGLVADADRRVAAPRQLHRVLGRRRVDVGDPRRAGVGRHQRPGGVRAADRGGHACARWRSRAPSGCRASTCRRCASRASTSSSRTGARSSRRPASAPPIGSGSNGGRARWCGRRRGARRSRAIAGSIGTSPATAFARLRRQPKRRACRPSCASSAPAVPTDLVARRRRRVSAVRARRSGACSAIFAVLGVGARAPRARRPPPRAGRQRRRCSSRAAVVARPAPARAGRIRASPRRCCSGCTARAFDTTHPWRDAIVRASAISVGAYVLFVRVLQVSLPAGHAGRLALTPTRDGDARSCSRDGFANALTLPHLAWALAGVTLGTAVGVLPGIGPALTVALLLPVTFSLDPISAFIMFGGIYYGAMYGGSTTSILLNYAGRDRVDRHGHRRPHDGAPGPRRRGADDRRHRIVRRRHARHARADVLRARCWHRSRCASGRPSTSR